MSKLPIISGRDCIRALQRGGFTIDRQKGSHVTLVHHDSSARVTVPTHKVLKRGMLRGIIKDAGLTVNEFVELLND